MYELKKPYSKAEPSKKANWGFFWVLRPNTSHDSHETCPGETSFASDSSEVVCKTGSPMLRPKRQDQLRKSTSVVFGPVYANRQPLSLVIWWSLFWFYTHHLLRLPDLSWKRTSCLIDGLKSFSPEPPVDCLRPLVSPQCPAGHAGASIARGLVQSDKLGEDSLMMTWFIGH